MTEPMVPTSPISCNNTKTGIRMTTPGTTSPSRK